LGAKKKQSMLDVSWTMSFSQKRIVAGVRLTSDPGGQRRVSGLEWLPRKTKVIVGLFETYVA
jgi:hypothetical protein